MSYINDLYFIGFLDQENMPLDTKIVKIGPFTVTWWQFLFCWWPSWISQFWREPLDGFRGSRDFWIQRPQKPHGTSFGAFCTKCTSQPFFVTYHPHY